MNIYVVRHGQTDWNVEGRYQGIKDIPLNKNGIEQAREVANKIENNNLSIDLIISSPLGRALETAKMINNKLNVDLIEDKRIVERNYGDLEGVQLDSKRHVLNEQMLDMEIDYKEYNVEKLSELFKRVYEFLDEIVLKYKDKNIILVTHNGVAIIIDCYFNGIPEDNKLINLAMKNCELRKYKGERNA